ncbi:peptidoglycan-binding domain-containing protein [Streptomyces sp. NPDC002133]|uniref:peptidoglycan-binding domain-containing protein n=1 Tax=Streptomyces sp. NPDC002133 TaxID=3154409 RepID=UPI00331D823F
MTGRACPECGTPPTEVCGCAMRAERSAGRSAEIAEAEDFDPLRIRPYVTLGSPPEASGPPPESLAAGQSGPGPDTSMDGPATQEIVYEYELTAPAAGPVPDGPVRRRGPGVLIAAAAVVAVLGTAAFAGGLLSADEGGERALPDIETMEPFLSGVPEASVDPSASKKASPSPSASASASASVPASPSGTASASGTAVAAAPGSPSTTTRATGQVSQSPATSAAPLTLRPGDNGAEVVELQERLDQIRLYDGPPHGHYDGRVEDAVATYQQYRGIDSDPEGVYGPATRRALEADTEYPYDGGSWDDDDDWNDNGGGRGD